MWIFVFFDLPTETKSQVKAASEFRENLLNDGFLMFQYSIYIRNCASKENAEVHQKRVKSFLPKYGKVSMMTVTDRQFSEIDVFFNTKPQKANSPGQQLELF